MLERVAENRTLLHCWWQCKSVQPLWKIWELFQQPKAELQDDLQSWHISRENLALKGNMHPGCTAAQLKIAKTTGSSLRARQQKERCKGDGTCIHWNITQPWKEWNNAIALDGPRGCYTGWSQRQKYCMILLRCILFKKWYKRTYHLLLLYSFYFVLCIGKDMSLL